jgi:hypothetical protein
LDQPVREGWQERVYQGYDAIKAREPHGAPPRHADAQEQEDGLHYYNGPVKFYKLASTLQKISSTMGAHPHNRNVLFAASSLRSAANLIPMACTMARLERNFVHLVVFGRSVISMNDIKDLNGVDETCTVYFHDARGDYAEYSSDVRAESATLGAMKHVQDYMHPQAIIIDDASKEDVFFTKAMRKRAQDYDKPLIEIPKGGYEEFMWMMNLDAASLAAWFQPTIDIVIQASRGSSGRLIRLLQSLSNANYRGIKVPRLTIELPPEVESSLRNYLTGFTWPPRKTPSQPSLLTIRHRIPSSRLTSEQASLRFVESFYPDQPKDHHVLVMTPQAEVNSLYLQYLHYLILHYRYSPYQYLTGQMMGISLDLPASLLNGHGVFKQPLLSDMKMGDVLKNEDDRTSPAPFLYQAPSSTAILIFGDKWATFHDFLANRMEASHGGKAKKLPKLVSELEPSWVEYLLELMRARNWFVMHPSSVLVTIHNELARIPEEHLREGKRDADDPEEAFTTSQESPVMAEHVEKDAFNNNLPLHHMLPFDGELQSITSLPHVGYNGSLVTELVLANLSDEYVVSFRKAVGGCPADDATRQRIVNPLETGDLFCLPGQDMNYFEGLATDEDVLGEGAKPMLNSEDPHRREAKEAGPFASRKRPGPAKMILKDKAEAKKGEGKTT